MSNLSVGGNPATGAPSEPAPDHTTGPQAHHGKTHAAVLHKGYSFGHASHAGGAPAPGSARARMLAAALRKKPTVPRSRNHAPGDEEGADGQHGHRRISRNLGGRGSGGGQGEQPDDDKPQGEARKATFALSRAGGARAVPAPEAGPLQSLAAQPGTPEERDARLHDAHFASRLALRDQLMRAPDMPIDAQLHEQSIDWRLAAQGPHGAPAPEDMARVLQRLAAVSARPSRGPGLEPAAIPPRVRTFNLLFALFQFNDQHPYTPEQRTAAINTSLSLRAGALARQPD